MKAAVAGPNRAISPKIRETSSSKVRPIESTYARTTYALNGWSRISLAVVDLMAISRRDATDVAGNCPSQKCPTGVHTRPGSRCSPLGSFLPLRTLERDQRQHLVG